MGASGQELDPTMRAVVQEGQGSAEVLSVREVPLPELADDRVLVKVHAASINALDYHTVHGMSGAAGLIGRLLKMGPTTPYRGVDVAGVVTRVGKDVTTLGPGDEVFGCGRGTWAEYATATARGLVVKPPRLSFVEAGAVGVAALTALQAVRDHGAVKAGSRVLVYGAAGGVGTFATQIAKALGAHVTAVTSAGNVEVVSALGADEIVDGTREDALARGVRYDAVIDIAAVRPLGALLRVLRPGGRLVSVGAAKRGGLAVFARVIGVLLRRRLFKQPLVFFVADTRQEDLAFLARLLEEGRIHPVIERTYPLDEVRAAVGYALTGKARAKVVLVMPAEASASA